MQAAHLVAPRGATEPRHQVCEPRRNADRSAHERGRVDGQVHRKAGEGTGLRGRDHLSAGSHKRRACTSRCSAFARPISAEGRALHEVPEGRLRQEHTKKTNTWLTSNSASSSTRALNFERASSHSDPAAPGPISTPKYLTAACTGIVRHAGTASSRGLQRPGGLGQRCIATHVLSSLCTCVKTGTQGQSVNMHNEFRTSSPAVSAFRAVHHVASTCPPRSNWIGCLVRSTPVPNDASRRHHNVRP